ncbi:MAG: rod shape-determining protein MreD [Lachnospiraceae bacterium]|nr:rod shape-determining protein MreD [Lachnospiraceae bacterium]
MKRVLVSFLMILVIFIMQGTLFKAIAFSGVAPNAVLMLVSCFGFMRGQNEGMMVGFVCGLLTDAFFGGGIIGIYAFIYTLMGYINGYFHRIFYPEDIKLPIIFIAISDFTYWFIVYIVMFLLRRRMDLLSYMRRVMMPEAVYTVLITLVLYRVVLAINTSLEAKERENEAKFV